MAWGADLLAGLGGAMQGGLAVHQQQKAEEYRRQRDEQIDDLKKQLAEMKGTQQLEQIEKRNVGKQALQALVNVGKLDLKRLENEGDAYVQELRNSGALSVEEARSINRMSVAEIAAEARKYAADKGLEGTKYGADRGYQRGVDVAGINANADITTTGMRTGSAEKIAADEELGRTKRFFEGTLPVSIGNMEAGQARARNSGDPYNLQPQSEKPQFTPWNRLQGLGQTPPPAAPAPAPWAPAPAPAPPPSRLFGPGSGGLGGLSTPGAAPPAMPPAMPPAAPRTAPAPQPAPVAPPAAPAVSPAPGATRMAPPAPTPGPWRPGGSPSEERVRLGAEMKAWMDIVAKEPPGPLRKQKEARVAALAAKIRALPR